MSVSLPLFVHFEGSVEQTRAALSQEKAVSAQQRVSLCRLLKSELVRRNGSVSCHQSLLEDSLSMIRRFG